MATLTIRNFDDDVYERLKRDAKANHRSLEAEIRARLGGTRPSRAELLDRLRDSMIDPGPDYPGSVEEVRAIRNDQ